MTVLEVRGLTTGFGKPGRELVAVRDVSFSVGKGEIFGLVGESGSGKSVTGLSVMGLINAPGRIMSGSVRLNGTELIGLNERGLRQIRGRRMAMVFQDPTSTLNPVLRIDTQMVEALRAHHRMSYAEAWARSRDTLGLVGIPSPDARMRCYPHEFSGGMRQRVAIAIAMLNDAELIVADEPTTALDVTIQSQILATVQKLAAERGISWIWVTHDLSVISGIADQIGVMYGGRLVEQGHVDDVLASPMHPYTRGLLDSLPAAVEDGQPLRQIDGMAPPLADMPSGCAFAPRCFKARPRCDEAPEPRSAGASRVRCHYPLHGQDDDRIQA